MRLRKRRRENFAVRERVEERKLFLVWKILLIFVEREKSENSIENFHAHEMREMPNLT